MWVSRALLIDCSGEGALLMECSSSECHGCEDSSYSSYHAACTLTPGCVRSCYTSEGCCVHLSRSKGLLSFNDSFSITWSRSKGRCRFYLHRGAYPGVGSYLNSYIALGWCSDAFKFSHTPWIIASYTCLRAYPNRRCQPVSDRNWMRWGRS